MNITRPLIRALALLMLTSTALAATVESVRVDLKPLIRAGARNPVQFAVQVPHRASLASSGKWTSLPSGGRAEWTYAVRIPSAVSMSFHASHIRLPPESDLTVRSAVTTVVYHSATLRESDLWSRVQPGDSLQFTLSVPSAARNAAVLEIQSLQAGYRALGAGAKDHPYYTQLTRQAAAGNTGCIQNYKCNVTASNTPIAAATVAIVIENAYQCSGTLLNNVTGDNTPYVLTARHCENGVPGGGAPENAASLVVYWDATSACGADLGSIYDPGVAAQMGATTVVEQQDAWLVQLNSSPVVGDAQFAGFDASGAAVQGGYTVHHALGYNKQFTQWFGQAYPTQEDHVLGTGYLSHFLETVNQLGNIGPGASGSGLIDSHDRLVGSLSLGRTTNDTSGYESCPVNPVAPNGSNGTADFTSLAAVWSSAADSTVTAGGPTLKSILDPGNTGTQILASLAATNLHFSASSYSLTDGDSLVLSWNAVGATQCTATDGANSDGWSGALPSSGQHTVTESFGGTVTYGLRCQLAGGRAVVATLQVSWYGSVPFAFLDSFQYVWTGANATLTWGSNVTPCAISGGTLALTDLPSSGSITTTSPTPGDVKYTLSCGSGPATSSSTLTQTYVAPTVAFRANGTDRRVGEMVTLRWWSFAERCVPSGGAANDGWSGSVFGSQNSYSTTVLAPGTYTYTLACTGGPHTITQSVTVTVENDPAYTTASVTPTTVAFTDSPADYFTLNWKTNLSSCALNWNPGSLQGQASSSPFPAGGIDDAEDAITYAPLAPGDYVVTVDCTALFGAAQSEASAPPVTVHVLPPPAPTVVVSISPATVIAGQNFTVSWSSSYAKNCMSTGSGFGIGDIWEGQQLAVSGSQIWGGGAGTATLGVTCQSIDPNQPSASAQASVTVLDAPTATLSVSPAYTTVGDTVTLTWSSTDATSCTASGGGANGAPWSGTLGPSGTAQQTTSVTGPFTYAITCSSPGSNSAQSDVVLTVTPKAPSTSESGGGGGGGSLGMYELFLLSLLAAWRRAVAGRNVRVRAVATR